MNEELQTEQDFEHYLSELLSGEETIDRVNTFQEAGVLTRNAGLVVRTSDGRQFQITIVRSR